MLNEKGLDINILDTNKNNILLLAAKQGVKNNLRYIKKLIELGANPNLSNLNNENFYSESKRQALSDEGFTRSYLENINISGSENLKKSKKLTSRYYNTILTAIIVLVLVHYLNIKL